jgi:hypothetical protein
MIMDIAFGFVSVKGGSRDRDSVLLILKGKRGEAPLCTLKNSHKYVFPFEMRSVLVKCYLPRSLFPPFFIMSLAAPLNAKPPREILVNTNVSFILLDFLHIARVGCRYTVTV